MRHFLLTLALSTFTLLLQAQTFVLTGTVTDAITGETLPGVSVSYATGKGGATDIDGRFSFSLPPGKYELEVNYVNYQSYKRTVDLKSNTNLDIALEGNTTGEVEVVADIAVDRKTPIAFSDIPSIKIKEELGARDLPMILNTTPGVYATQTGGGDGDARVNIRGFNQRNIAVMIDGIPMNDMENGWVYWSNWFGLDNVIQKTQVQRGLGATKLSVPSIGGSMNIITAGIENKSKLTFVTEFGNTMNLRESIGYNSGKLKGDWGITAALSLGKNQGWVENLGSRRMFYYIKVQKNLGRHSFTLSAMGSPQEHNQRQQRQTIEYYDSDYARQQGIDVPQDATGAINLGLRHNQFWGTLRRSRNNPNAEEETLSSLKNYYHKPIYNFKHFYSKDKFSVSNIVYASTGNGGGTQLQNPILTAGQQVDFQSIYNSNTTGTIFVPPYDLTYVNDTSQYKARNFIFSLRNDHYWGGLLSTVKYKLNSAWEFNGGIDARYYQTHRYKQVYDLLGGDYLTSGTPGQGLNQNDPNKVVFREGETFDYDIRSYVRQAGLFFLAEYSADTWSAFVNVTGSVHQYNREDYFQKKKEDGSVQSSGWLNFNGYTAKGGVNYNINKRMNVFFNSGYLNRAPLLANTYVRTTFNTYDGLKNEIIQGNEIGYGYKTKELKVNVNAYYTSWKNRPVVQTINVGTETYSVNVPGMNAIHAGVELDMDYKPMDKLSFNGVVSLGNWKWDSDASAVITSVDGTQTIGVVNFSAKGVAVGDAAQTQYSAGIRYSPVKNMYISPRWTYFSRYFADFDPETLRGENANRQSWMIPAYYTFDVNAGYEHPIGKDRYTIGYRLSLINVTNQTFISDARNNDFGNGFDATSAGVYMGQGFRWNFAVSFTY